MNKKGQSNIIGKGASLVMFFFVVLFMGGIAGTVLYTFQQSQNNSFGEGSPPHTIAGYGVNATSDFMSQVPAAASIGGIVIVILIVVFAVGDFLGKKGGGQQNQSLGSDGFGLQ